MKETVKIFYKKQMWPRSKEVNMDDYVLVCELEIERTDGLSDNAILEDQFYLFNWQDSKFQPDDEEVGFNRNGADHTSMSVGDIVEINGKKYYCDSFGWSEATLSSYDEFTKIISDGLRG